MQNYLRLLSFLKQHKSLFGLAVGAMFVATLLEGVQWSLLVPLTDRILNNKSIVVPNSLPGPITRIVDYLNHMEPSTLLWTLPVFVFFAMMAKHASIFSYQYFMNDLSQRVLRDIRQRLYAKIQNLSLDYFTEKRTGELVSRITHDVQLVENAVSYGVTDLVRQTFMIVMYVVMAFSIHPRAAFIIFFVYPLIGWPISRIGKKLRKLAKSSQERMADINSILLETISGIRVVKAFCTEDYEIKRFYMKNHEFYKLKMKSVKRMLLMNPITELFGLICGITIIFWLGKQVMTEHMSFGTFILFFLAIMSIISPIKKLGNVHALTQQALSANERIYDILDAMPSVEEKKGAGDLPIIRNKISIENVIFRYDEDSGNVLKNISLEIKVGELVAIVGRTGTGKSTLVNLISRFYDPNKGAVLIDGVNLRDVTIRSLRTQIGIVAQETFLFNDSVKANIAYGYPNASAEEIEEAARRAYAHQFIIEMPGGYDTVIGDRGFRLSGGEKQRIAIARAILKNPPILILDEATSQLDSESEKFVQDALDKLMEGRTVIAIAHRLSTIKKADKIIVLDKGEIVGQAPHEDLLKTCELYKRLYETQFQIAAAGVPDQSYFG